MSCISSAKFCQVAAAYKPSFNILLVRLSAATILWNYQNFKTFARNNISLHYWRDNNVLLLSFSAFCCYLTTLDGTVVTCQIVDNIVLSILLFERLCAVATWRNSDELLQTTYLHSIAHLIILLLLSCVLSRCYLTEIGGTVSKMLKGR